MDIVPIPALIVVLHNKEKAKGEPLTKAEVLQITNEVECVAMEREHHLAVIEARGYLDIDPENSWEGWQDARQEFDDLPGVAST